MQLIYVAASDLAAACSLHYYQDARSVLARTWMRECPEQYHRACHLLRDKMAVAADSRQQQVLASCEASLNSAVGQEDTHQRAQLVQEIQQTACRQYESAMLGDMCRAAAQLEVAGTLRRVTSLEELMAALSVAAVSSPQEQQQQLEVLLKQVQLLIKSRALLSASIIRSVNVARGHWDEDAAVQAYSEQRQVQVVDGNKRMYYLNVHMRGWGVGVRIGGKVDGWLQDKNVVLEVKNRQRRLFKRARTYERVQCEAYLRLTGADSVQFMEKFQGTTWGTDIKHDEELWERVKGGLQQFVQDFMELQQSTHRQMEMAALCKSGCLRIR